MWDQHDPDPPSRGTGPTGLPPDRCPRCMSPRPELHPATQYEGEVQPCPHPWHEGEL